MIQRGSGEHSVSPVSASCIQGVAYQAHQRKEVTNYNFFLLPPAPEGAGNEDILVIGGSTLGIREG